MNIDLNEYVNKSVIVIDAKGGKHEGYLVGFSSINSSNALIKISDNKIMEIPVKFIKGV